MHEMGITAEIIKSVLEACEKGGATKLNTVHATVGELTEVVPDSLQFAWETLTPGTFAEGSVLEITETPGRSVCLECGTEFTHDRFDRICSNPDCRSFATQVIGGNELRVDGIDVDVPESDTPGTDAPESDTPGADVAKEE
jgi:hydrogenase nickel incorporation protein HypA/HybF